MRVIECNVPKHKATKNHYCYHGLLYIKDETSSANQTQIQQIVDSFQHVGLHYSPQQHVLSILTYRRQNDPEVLAALVALAKVLPSEKCYRVEAVGQADEHDFGYLLYQKALYRVDNLAQPTKPYRLVVGQLAKAA
jgi:hypothetical protein